MFINYEKQAHDDHRKKPRNLAKIPNSLDTLALEDVWSHDNEYCFFKGDKESQWT